MLKATKGRGMDDPIRSLEQLRRWLSGSGEAYRVYPPAALQKELKNRHGYIWL